MPASPPSLDARFLQPEGWRWATFERAGRSIRYGYAHPETADPQKPPIVCLPGLSEFGEKYFETAQECLARGHSFFVMDWFGQGQSGRYFEDTAERRQKRHSYSFDDDLADLDLLITAHLPADRRLIMLAHSMGGHLGLRYLAQNPERFYCAGISAPLMDIPALPPLPLQANVLLTGVFNLIRGHDYVFGGGPWQADMRPDGDVRFSHDLARAKIHNIWCLHEPALQIGSVTFGWLHQAVRSCLSLRRVRLQTPCLIATAGREEFVKNAAIASFIQHNPSCIHAHYDRAAHEILMEKDAVRGDFLQQFFTLIDKNTNP